MTCFLAASLALVIGAALGRASATFKFGKPPAGEVEPTEFGAYWWERDQ